MTTDLERRVRAGLREYVESVPVEPPPTPVAGIVRPAAGHVPGRMRRIGLPLLAAAALIAVVTLVPVGLTLRDAAPTPTPTGDDRPGLPSRFAPYSFLTADLDRAPISRAVAVYAQPNDVVEDWNLAWQLVLLDADGDRYRRIPQSNAIFSFPGDFHDQTWRLSPDGRHLAIHRVTGPGPTLEWSVLELATGSARPIPRDLGEVTGVLAWSPDARRVAYFAQRASTEVEVRFVVWDLDSGQLTSMEGSTIREATFSPDGRHLAVRVGSEIRILDEALTVQRRLPIGERDIIAGPAAWSPDGTRIAVERLRSQRDKGLPIGLRAIRVADGSGTAEASLDEHDEPQGWRNDGSFVVWNPLGIVEISMATGTRTMLAETGGAIVELQVATGLLADLVVREPGDIDRGPWPWWARTTAALTGVLVGLVTVALVLRYSLRRRWEPIRDRTGGPPDAARA
jgi:hypothetical protein